MDQQPTTLAARWRFATPILLVALSLCVGVAAPSLFGWEAHNHRDITIERAAEILQKSLDPDLRAGAVFALDLRVRRAIAALRREVANGNADAAIVLEQWLRLLKD